MRSTSTAASSRQEAGFRKTGFRAGMLPRTPTRAAPTTQSNRRVTNTEPQNVEVNPVPSRRNFPLFEGLWGLAPAIFCCPGIGSLPRSGTSTTALVRASVPRRLSRAGRLGRAPSEFSSRSCAVPFTWSRGGLPGPPVEVSSSRRRPRSRRRLPLPSTSARITVDDPPAHRFQPFRPSGSTLLPTCTAHRSERDSRRPTLTLESRTLAPPALSFVSSFLRV